MREIGEIGILFDKLRKFAVKIGIFVKTEITNT